uniref:Uncharacterized protein n=1 Tax=Arundo donax TaxID=35708 RepID=A0A0A8YNM2_ARUDO
MVVWAQLQSSEYLYSYHHFPARAQNHPLPLNHFWNLYCFLQKNSRFHSRFLMNLHWRMKLKVLQVTYYFWL